MGTGGHTGVTDLNKDTVALVVVLTVTVCLLKQSFCVADLTSDATAWHCLKVCAGAKRLCAKFLRTSRKWICSIVKSQLPVTLPRFVRKRKVFS